MIPKKILDRKIKLSLKNTIIKGPKSVGKTYLVFNFLSTINKSFDYIDCELPLQQESKEEILILDNFNQDCPIPKNKITYIITDKNINIKDFEIVELSPLDFEEFFSFDKSFSISHSFDKFFKIGNFPKSIFLDDFSRNEYLKERFKLLNYDKDILKFFFSHIGEKFTLYQVFQIIKKIKKISKDTFYYQVNKMIEDKILFEVEKFNHPKSPKKFFAYNFAFKNILTHKKNPTLTFENIVFLEIKDKKPYYKDKLSFYLPNNNFGIMVIPFATQEIVKEKLQEINNLDKLLVITISNEFKIDCKKFKVEVVPFYQWRFAE